MNTAEAEGGGEFGSWYAQDATAYSLTPQSGAALNAAEGLRELVEIAEQHAERVDRKSAGDLADQGEVAAGIPAQLRKSLDAVMAQVEAEQSKVVGDLDAVEWDAAAFERDPIAALMNLVLVERDEFEALACLLTDPGTAIASWHAPYRIRGQDPAPGDKR